MRKDLKKQELDSQTKSIKTTKVYRRTQSIETGTETDPEIPVKKPVPKPNV
jgi:hypothetical protein